MIKTRIQACMIYAACVSANLLNASDDGRPNEHICPITSAVMVDPVVAADGHTYERYAIEVWFRGHATSPITRETLDKTLFPNQSLKTMIAEWRPGRQSEPSPLATKPASEIAQHIRDAFASNAQLMGDKHSSKGQNIVAFLGNTGAGKSTLVNLLAGKELKVGDDGEDYVLVNAADVEAMPIGLGGSSQTLYPKSIDIDVPDAGILRLFDLPGFNDTDGSERNLVNAAFTRKILMEAASVRLVFVAGQDQFTADRSSSIRQMFSAIKNLFVVEGQDHAVINDGTFVATKITGNTQAGTAAFLLKKTDSSDKAVLHEQLQFWEEKGKLCTMQHPVKEPNLQEVRYKILGLIGKARVNKVVGINVSALYPPQTQKDLERMFLEVMENYLKSKLSRDLITLSDYDSNIASYSAEGFWDTLSSDLCEEEGAVGLLRDFCINPYNKSFLSFKELNATRIQSHIQKLKGLRQQRVNDVESRTEAKAVNVIAGLVPQVVSEFVMFDFAYHKDFYEQVCGVGSLNQLATDPLEQEVVRKYYAGFIARHSHEQMIRWHQMYSGQENILVRLANLERSINRIEQQQVPSVHQVPQVVHRDVVQRSLGDGIVIPDIARGNEDVYRMFLGSKLIYKPDPNSDNGKIELAVSSLTNPLSGEFDLSGCGDSGKYLSINTGYRTGQRQANANKLEIWFVLRFVVERDLAGPAKHLQPIWDEWPESNSVGIFFTLGEWNGAQQLTWYDYLTTLDAATLSNGENLFLNPPRHDAIHRTLGQIHAVNDLWAQHAGGRTKNFIFSLQRNK